MMSGHQDKTILIPQPKEALVTNSKRNFTISVLKENMTDEKRVALTPVGVQTLVQEGATVYVVSGSGNGANYSDEDYRKAGAKIVDFQQAIKAGQVLVKVSPFTNDQIQQLPTNKILFSALHPNTQIRENFELLMQKNITGIAYEFYEDENGLNPFVHLMNEITGSTSVMLAAELLSNIRGGKGIMLGGLTGITPSEIIVLGTDTAAQYAVRIALGLGSAVKVFDDDLHGLLRLKQLFGQQLFTSTFNRQVLWKSFQSADVVINSKARNIDEEPFIIEQDLVKVMKNGSVIIDLKIDVGSIVETSKPTTFDSPIYEKFGVIHYCVPNIPSRVSRTASIAISNVLTPILKELCQVGDILPLLKKYVALRNATYTYLGMLTNVHIANRFKLNARDLNLLLALF